MNSFISYHNELNPKLWDNFKLRKDIKRKLKKIADFFVKFSEIPHEYIKDYLITGSNANYNYTDFSDIDLHILIDIPEDKKEIYNKYLDAKRKIFNITYDIKIKGYNVELYPQLKDEVHYSTGVYSILKDKWLIKPEFRVPEIDSSEIRAKAEKILSQIKKIKDCNDYKGIKRLVEKIKKFRKAGLSKKGEFSTENIIFKQMRNSGLIKTILDCMNTAISKELSLENLQEKAKIKKSDFKKSKFQ